MKVLYMAELALCDDENAYCPLCDDEARIEDVYGNGHQWRIIEF